VLTGVSVRFFAKEDFMKTRNIIITIMLLFVLFVTGCTPAGVPSGPATNPTNPSTEPTVPTTPDIENLSLYEKLPYIVADACKRAKTTETIDAPNGFVSYCAEKLGIPHERIRDEETGLHHTRFTTTDGDYEAMAYLLTLLTLTEDYSDCFYYTDQDYNGSYDRLRFYILFITDQYIAAGYETPEEYYRAIKNRECDAHPDAIGMWFDGEKQIELFNSPFGEDSNLWPSLFANANNSN
jgi:hypothetical protein